MVKYYDPFFLEVYKFRRLQELKQHKHKEKPCHITIVASGAVRVVIFNDDGSYKRQEDYHAPSICDYTDGAEGHHKLIALEDGTVFYNVHRHVALTKEEIAALLENDE